MVFWAVRKRITHQEMNQYYLLIVDRSTVSKEHFLFLIYQDIAQLIVERTTVMNYILPSISEDLNKQSLDTLEALIFLFVNYLRKAKEQNKAGYSWVSLDEFPISLFCSCVECIPFMFFLWYFTPFHLCHFDQGPYSPNILKNNFCLFLLDL